MRRKDKAVENREEIDRIIRGAEICRLAMALEDEPYLVPLNFGYDGKSLFFHSAPTGKKIDLLRRNGKVWFEIEGDCRIMEGSTEACGWSMAYESVMGAGRAVFLKEPEEKRRALDLLMGQYKPEERFRYRQEALERVEVFRVDIESVTAKRSPTRKSGEEG